ncbi:hypothetical protein GCM10008933_39380 [Paenibacillus motobuensis]|uniref:Uncharacterized protein n=1 Tax=Paenibacillus motobuensis TaxID=295324 RepID=A0ABN0YQ73_9BACL
MLFEELPECKICTKKKGKWEEGRITKEYIRGFCLKKKLNLHIRGDNFVSEKGSYQAISEF